MKSAQPKTPVKPVAATSKTPSKTPTTRTEHEKPLPPCLEDFIIQYDSEKGTIEPWAQELVHKFAEQIKEKIRVHWKDSAKTRRMFTNVQADTVWEDESTKTMILSRRNFGLFEAGFIPSLEESILSEMKVLIEKIRSDLRGILGSCYCSESEVSEVERSISNKEPSGYSIAEYGRHLELFNKWVFEFKSRYAAIEYCRKREQFILQCIKWEEQNKNLVTAKGTSSILRWVPQFRNDVIKIYKESSVVATKLLADAESRLGKPVLFNGVSYSEFLKKQEAQLSRAKTSFASFKVENLLFVKAGEGEGQETISTSTLDPALEQYTKASDALPAPSPPPMPLYAAEVKFQFEYH